MPREMPKFTKTPPELVAAFDAARPDRADVVRKTMFGYPAFFVNGNMFAFTFGARIAVRVDDAHRAKLGAAGKPFEVMPGRAMNEYVELPASAVRGAALKKWIAQGLACAEALPAKDRKGARKTSEAKRTSVAKQTSRTKGTSGTKKARPR